MTTLLEGARKLVGRRGSDVAARLDGLQQAVEASRGRLDDHLVDSATEVIERASATTVWPAQPVPGSHRRSTHSPDWTMACAWGADGAGELLDWLGVPKRHQVERSSLLDSGSGPGNDQSNLQGLVLLDLPDHDSTEVAHHVEVDRLVQLADMLVWMLDPQKYADAAIHDRYLKPMASHKEVMLVVLNHIDEVAPERRQSMVDDLRRILAADGLEGVPVVVTSARHGEGIPELRSAIAARVTAKKATRSRLSD